MTVEKARISVEGAGAGASREVVLERESGRGGRRGGFIYRV